MRASRHIRPKSLICSTCQAEPRISTQHRQFAFSGSVQRAPQGGRKPRTSTSRREPEQTGYRSGIKFVPTTRRRDPYDFIRGLLPEVKDWLSTAPIVPYLEKDGLSFEDTFAQFLATAGLDRSQGYVARNADLIESLKQAVPRTSRVFSVLTQGYFEYVTNLRLAASEVHHQKLAADCRFPSEWFPRARTLTRKIHLHVGPTNSGKTYHALRALENAQRGLYAGPLRLLAHEVYTRINQMGRPCSLVTGEEIRRPKASELELGQGRMVSSTVEMCDFGSVWDVAVLDEIQMLGSRDRGWAWTQALLGLQAHELHLCGEKRTVPLIKRLLAYVGETPIIHEYERLAPLKIDEASLKGELGKLRKGDCVVSFSVMGIHALRNAIEAETGKKVAIVYGSLPPETRAQQARLFNDPDNDYDFLVASDAIGMGLNLSIKRVIFESTIKFDGHQRAQIGIADLKQIAGRAGRYRAANLAASSSDAENASAGEDGSSAKTDTVAAEVTSKDTDRPYNERYRPRLESDEEAIAEKERLLAATKARPVNDPANFGLVTTLESVDFRYVAKSLEVEPEPIKTAGLQLSSGMISRFSQYFPPGTPFSFIFSQLTRFCNVGEDFHVCTTKDQQWVADLIEPLQGLSVSERQSICNAPLAERDGPMLSALVLALARCIEEQHGGALYDIPEIPIELLEIELQLDREHLRELELLHKGLTLYLWLAFRFAGVFSTRALALEMKGRVEERIGKVLAATSVDATKRRKVVEQRRKEVQALELKERLKAEAQVADTQSREPGSVVSVVGDDEDVGLDDQSVDADVLVEDGQALDIDGDGESAPTIIATGPDADEPVIEPTMASNDDLERPGTPKSSVAAGLKKIMPFMPQSSLDPGGGSNRNAVRDS